MEELRYSLTEEEYICYCKCALYQDSAIRRERISLMLSVPVLLVFLLVYFKPKGIYIAAALAAAAVWLLAANMLFLGLLNRYIKKTLKKKKVDEVFREIHIRTDSSGLEVDGEKVSVLDYTFLPHMISLKCENRGNVVVPLRVFTDNRQAAQFLKHALCQ